ncbi:hypothetical protein [Thioalkalivibrio sp. ALE20]|uniref:hypothetical protein n=1 Tax=Thioalkalivibrio sp. ALE20 TaxID=545275 RepID=UPI0012E9F6E5|nr:hypothetical protein [Thioalkalivibrio sp. ALE20]
MSKNVVVNRLKKGTANKGLFEGRVQDGDSPCFKFVEKRVCVESSEFALCGALHRDRVSSDPFLSILGVRKGPDGVGEIYMEYLPGAGGYELPDINRERAHDEFRVLSDEICHGLARFAKYAGSNLEHKSPASVCKRVSLVRLIYKTGLRVSDSVVKALARSEEKLFRRASVDRICFSHNDLHFHNLWVRGSAERVKLIDYGMVRQNMMGADLHHFFRRWMRGSQSDRDFFDALVESYVRYFDVSDGWVRAVACYYGLYRELRRGGLGDLSREEEKEALQRYIDFLVSMQKGRACLRRLF